MKDNPKILELVWAAGFFDGEGNIRWNKGKTKKKDGRTREYGSVVLQLAQTDAYVLNRFKTAVSGGKVYGPYDARSEKRKPYFTYMAVGTHATEVFSKIKPFLSPVKIEQGEITLKKLDEQNSRPRLDARFKKKKDE